MTGADEVGVLLMAHGTPTSLDELAGFYTEIRRGRPPSEQQLAELRGRYEAIGGTSPLNETTAMQAKGLQAALDGRHHGRFAVCSGARFASPRIEDAASRLVDAGVRRIIGLVLAPHSSQVSVGEYRRRAQDALAALGVVQSVPLHVVDHWHDAPGFASLVASRVRDAVVRLTDGVPVTVVFTAHSIPERVVEGGDDYPDQVLHSAQAAAEAAGVERWCVAWQSAGRTEESWLGPDVRDVIADLAKSGARGVVVCPIGFVADHLEVLYDIDIEARTAAEDGGIAFARTQSFNAADDFCRLLAEVVVAADEERHP